MEKLFGAIFLAVIFFTAASVIERPKRAANCNKRIPMTDYFEYGYDITEFDAFACPEIDGKRAKIANMNTCDKGEKYKFEDKQKTEYDVPDPIFKVFQAPSTSMGYGQIYSDIKDFQEENVDSTAFEHYFDKLPGTQKAALRSNQFLGEIRRIFANKSRLAFIHYIIGVYGMGLELHTIDKKYFTPGFNSDLNVLPETYDGHEKQYEEFIKKYGTHIIVNARFGGLAFRYAEILNQDFHRARDIDYEMRKGGLDLSTSEPLDVICEKKTGDRQVLKVHSKSRNFTQLMIGGHADKGQYADKKSPVEEFKETPALVSSEVKAISTLIQDNETMKKNMEKALKVYFAKAYIKSKVNYIKTLLDAGRETRKKITELFTEVEQSVNNYNEEELRKLGNDLKNEANDLKYEPIK